VTLIVISYSRVHRAQVRALVRFLRVSIGSRIRDAIFWDDDLEPGDPWFEQIASKIDKAHRVYVFWCVHASTSEQVKREYSLALSSSTRVVPVLLDDTPLPPELARLHGLDLRGTIVHGPVEQAFTDFMDAERRVLITHVLRDDISGATTPPVESLHQRRSLLPFAMQGALAVGLCFALLMAAAPTIMEPWEMEPWERLFYLAVAVLAAWALRRSFRLSNVPKISRRIAQQFGEDLSH
jgi:hypothetical protein